MNQGRCMTDIKPMPEREVWFFGAQFDTPRTGGQLYNSKVVNYIKEHSDGFKAKSYPWASSWKNFWFDFHHALILAFSFKRRTVIINESQHQRLAFTLMTAMLIPWVKTVVMFHQLAYLRRSNSLHRKITRWIDKKLICNSSLSISAGLYLTDQMKKLVNQKYHHKIAPVLTTCQKIMPFSDKKKPFSATFVGTITRSKGIIELIEAIHLLPENLKSKLTIKLAGSLGDKDFVNQCLKKIELYKLNSQIQLLGLQDVQQLESLYQESELYLFPTHAEGMPMSLMEAMSAGCIPIVFSNTAMPYMVEQLETGLISENLNVFLYAKNIELYFSLSAEEKSKLRRNARERALKYARSWDQVAQEFHSKIKQLN